MKLENLSVLFHYSLTSDDYEEELKIGISAFVEILVSKKSSHKLKHAVRRNRALTLKELSRAKICSTPITCEGISILETPEMLKRFLRHFKFGNARFDLFGTFNKDDWNSQ